MNGEDFFGLVLMSLVTMLVLNCCTGCVSVSYAERQANRLAIEELKDTKTKPCSVIKDFIDFEINRLKAENDR